MIAATRTTLQSLPADRKLTFTRLAATSYALRRVVSRVHPPRPLGSPMSRFRCLPLPGTAPLTVLLVAWGLTTAGMAADFVVESRTFEGDQDTPLTRNQTVFQGERVYDFVQEGDEITLLDTARGRFVLMDRRRQVKTELTTDQVLQYTQHIQRWAAGKEDLLLQFYADPHFEVVEEGPDRLKLHAAPLSYEVRGVTAAGDVVSRYRQFCDWYARFNSAVSPGSQLPFPRLVLNSHLARRQLVPAQVQLTLAASPRFGGKPVRLRSEHTLRSEVTTTELRQIDQANRLLVTLRSVPLTEYRDVARTATR